MSVVHRIHEVVRAATPDQPRCPTPLRPSDALLSRIPPPPPSAPHGNRFPDLPFAATAPTSRPATQASKRHGALPRSGAAASSSASAAAAPKASPNQTFPGTDTMRSIVSDGGTRYSVHQGNGEDAYSQREKLLVAEVNLMRSDPVRYADTVARDAVVTPPYVPMDMTLPSLVKYSEELEAQRNRAAEQLEDLSNQKKKEHSQLHAEWVAEDIDRAKKAKKAMPKKGATPEPEMDSDRTEALHALEKKYAVLQKDLSRELEVATTAHQKATAGLKLLRECIAKLQSTPSHSLPPVVYNRGLSLAAREACVRSVTAAEAREMSKRYGMVGDRVALAQHKGLAGIRQVVCEILMGVQDPRKVGRNALLDPAMTAAGCGWRKRSKTESVTTFLLSAGFEELDAIHSRQYLSLDDVRRLLPSAASKAFNATTIITLQTQLPVRLVSPSSHPMTCGNSVRLLLECDASVELVASLAGEDDAQPTCPVIGTGDVLVQQTVDDGYVEVRAVLPCRGQFRVHLFARSREEAAVTGFHHIGSVRLHATSWHTLHIVSPFPTVTADFSERRCTLVSPLDGVLRPDEQYTFEIVVPLTNYLHRELERLDRTLAETVKKLQVGDREATAALLQDEIAKASSALETAKAQREAESATLASEIASQAKELAKKKGKELERAKAAILEMEDRLRAMDEAVETANRLLLDAQERAVAHRRAEKRAMVELQRFQRERQKFVDAADRRNPLHVQLSFDERRSDFTVLDHENTVYRLVTRMPTTPGPATVFINGLAAVLFQISE